MGKNVIAVTVTEITNDNRVINYTNALTNNGYVVNLICPVSSRRSSADLQFNPVYISLLASRMAAVALRVPEAPTLCSQPCFLKVWM